MNITVDSIDLVRSLREHGVRAALVIDNALDLHAADVVDDASIDEFSAQLQDDETLRQDLEDCGIDIEAVLRRDESALRSLSEKREDYTAAASAVETLLSDYFSERGPVNNLIRHLGSLGLKVTTLGGQQKVPDGLDVQIAFIDYFLDDAVVKSAPLTDLANADHAANARKKARAVYEMTRAFIVLMSSRSSVSNLERGFRQDARLLKGFFRFELKSELSEQGSLVACLSTLPLGAEFRHTLHNFIDQLDGSAERITKSFLKEVRELGLEDYACLRQLCLNREGHPFGDYIIRMFGAFLTCLVQEDPQLAGFVNELDDTNFDEFLPTRDDPSATLGRIYLASLTERLRKIISIDTYPLAPLDHIATAHDSSKVDHERGKEEATRGQTAFTYQAAPEISSKPDQEVAKTPLLVPVRLGDLFVKRSESRIYAIVNAACDLQLGSTRKHEAEDSLLLLPGKLRPLHAAYDGKRAPSMFTPLYADGDELFRIDWDYRQILTVAHRDLQKTLLSAGYICERRLQLGPALELQQHFTASTGRVGVAVPPPLGRTVDGTVFCRDLTGDWVAIGGHGFDLRLEPALDDPSSLPKEGTNLLYVSMLKEVLHFRILDGDGKIVVDIEENNLTEQTEKIGVLKDQLKELWPPRSMSENDKYHIIPKVTSILSYAHSKVSRGVAIRHMRDKDQFTVTVSGRNQIIARIKVHAEKLLEASKAKPWNGGGSRTEYAKSLQQLAQKWITTCPFLREPGTLPGGRTAEKAWSTKQIEVADKLGVCVTSKITHDLAKKADVVLSLNIGPMMLKYSEDLPIEMDDQ